MRIEQILRRNDVPQIKLKQLHMGDLRLASSEKANMALLAMGA